MFHSCTAHCLCHQYSLLTLPYVQGHADFSVLIKNHSDMFHDRQFLLQATFRIRPRRFSVRFHGLISLNQMLSQRSSVKNLAGSDALSYAAMSGIPSKLHREIPQQTGILAQNRLSSFQAVKVIGEKINCKNVILRTLIPFIDDNINR